MKIRLTVTIPDKELENFEVNNEDERYWAIGEIVQDMCNGSLCSMCDVEEFEEVE